MMTDQPRPFVHLHTHSHYSLLDGAALIPDMVKKAVEDGMPALGITDHGNLYGLYEHYQACKGAGIIPVLGCETYLDSESRFIRQPRSKMKANEEALAGLDMITTGRTKDRYHQIVLAVTTRGYYNLVGLASEAFLTGFYNRPRIDTALLEQYHEGLVLTSSCLGGLVPQALLNGQPDEARRLAGQLQDIVGKDNFYVELQDHGISIERGIRAELLAVARQVGAPLLATNDSHFVNKSDAQSHDVLLCLQTGAKIADEKRFKFSGSGYWMRTTAEMHALFEELPEAADNTWELAQRAQGVTIEHISDPLPHYEVPEQFRGEPKPDAAYLRHLVYEGAARRYGTLTTKITDQIEYELGVIDEMGYSAYFLIVWDIVNWARNNGVRVGPGRGSAAGSIVTYCTGISDLDPLHWGLIFERFLNPQRVSMPDIDLDFDDRRRPDVLAYIVSRFGADKVAQIITYTTIGSRSAARDSSRVLDFPYQLGQKIVDAMPPLRMGRDTPIAACMLPERPENDPAGWDRAAPLRELASTDRNVQDVLLIAQGLEGRVRQDGLHAAAVVISDRPLQELIPVQRKPLPGSKNGELGPLTTQYDMHAIEELGLLKMDCLGLRNLTVIQDTLDMIEETAGIKYELLEIPLDDAATYRLISTNAIGVFQLEQPDIRRFAQALNPQNFDDIGALNALYRPGPMGTGMHIDYADRRNGRKHDWEPMHPATADILEPTFGLMVFQEQMMQVAQKLAGFTSAEADNLRRACGKKDPVALGKQHDKFVQGCVDQGFGKQVGEQVFQTILPFSDYAFNKCVTGETKIQLDGRTIEVQELHRRLNSVLPAQQGRTGATAADKYEGPCVCCKQRPAVWRGYCRSCRSYRSKFYSGRPGEGLRSLSLLEDGRIQPSPIKDVHYNGRAPVWTVRLADGSEITGTANHRHRTPDGWKQVRELAVGDSLLTASPHGHPSGQVRRQDAESYRAVPVRIVAIEYAGVQDVYDLEMGSAGHNWVGNGIVTHNSHAYAYGLITYWTAWFKANWPAHYMAALLSSVTDSTERREIYLAECRRMGLVVLPPDINQARGDFWARKAPGGGWELVFGLSGIKGVGGTCVEHLVGLRAAGGPFSDFWDFASRVDSSRVTQPVLEALIAAGAFDSMGYSRKGLTKAAPDIMREQQQHTKQVSSGVQFLFDEPPARGGKIDKTEWPKRTLQSKERAVLNTYVTSHPLDDLLPVLQRACDTDVLTMLEDPEGWAEREQVTVGGMIDHRQEKTTKKGKTMGTFSLVGLGGSLEMIVFPTQWAECAGTVTNGEVVKVTGQLRMQEGLKGVAPQFVASAIERIAVAEGPPVRVDVADTDPRRLQSLQIALRRFPGDCPVFLVTPDDKIIALPAHWGCERSAACLKALHEIAGSELAAIAAPAPVAVAGPAAVPSDW